MAKYEEEIDRLLDDKPKEEDETFRRVSKEGIVSILKVKKI